MIFQEGELALLTLCVEGLASARALRQHMPGASLHVHQACASEDSESFARVAEMSATLWPLRRGLIYFAPSGAVIRSIAPLVASKYTDPAVVVCDVHARWAISLLSGHEGGANDLTLRVANHLGAEPIITTTSEAVKDLIIGLGCRRGCPESTLLGVIQEALQRVQMPLARVRYLASADIKGDEAGLWAVSHALNIPLRLMPSAQLRACLTALTPSPVAQRKVDLPGVAEPSALLAGRRTRLLLPRTVIQGCTVAIALEQRPSDTFLPDVSP